MPNPPYKDAVVLFWEPLKPDPEYLKPIEPDPEYLKPIADMVGRLVRERTSGFCQSSSVRCIIPRQ